MNENGGLLDTDRAPCTMRFTNKWLILVAAVFGLFMAILDASIVTIAVPTIQRELSTNIDNVTWVLNSYNIAFAVLLIPAGRVADRYGRRRLFIIGIIIFTFFSLLCGLAGDISLLIAWRTFQALGAAIMVPVSLAIVTVAFPAAQRGAAVGIWGAISGGAGAVGPTLGGLLTKYAGWEWIFFVNIPVGIIAVVACFFLIPESRDTGGSRRIDYLGVITLSVSLFALTLALVRGESVGWSTTFILGLFATSIVFGILFVIVESVVTDPIVDLRLFANRTFSASNVTMLLMGLGFFGALFLFVQYLTVVEGYSVLNAAFAVTPLPASIIIAGPISGRLSDRYGPRILSVVGLAIFGLAMFFFSRLSGGEAYVEIFWRLVLAGIGAGLAFPPLTSAAMGSLGGRRQGVGAGVFNTSRQVGFTLGLAVLVAVFLGALHPRLDSARVEATGVVEQSDLPQPLKQGVAQGLAGAVAEGNGESAISGEQQTFDLYDRVRQNAGEEVADANRSALDTLSQQLQAIFARAAASAFDRAFLVAATLLWLAIAPAYFVRRAADVRSPPAKAGA